MIEARNLTKSFGSLLALDSLTLDIGPGEVFGFIGPNGAGKSTTMKILSCLMKPDSGSARVGGFDVATQGDDIRRILGYMPDFLGVYDDLTVEEYLLFFASAFGISRSRRRATVDQVLGLTDLTEKRRAMVDSLSRGMQQRLGVARVLIHDPKVLLLDEPASGLDPRARIEMRALLTELGKMGKVLMISSHILSELAEMCSSIGIIERGKLQYVGSIQDAYSRTRGQSGERVEVRLDPTGRGAAELKPIIEADHRVTKVSTVASDVDSYTNRLATTDAAPVRLVGERLLVELTPGEHGHHFLVELIIRAGGRIDRFTAQEVSLEDAFLKLTTGALQ
jgi:ABC-2 type transport system ATP-binding protein